MAQFRILFIAFFIGYSSNCLSIQKVTNIYQNDSNEYSHSSDTILVSDSIINEGKTKLSQNSNFNVYYDSKDGKSSDGWILLLIDKAPSILLVLLIFLLFVVFNRQITSLVNSFATRIRHGATIKIGSFELGSIYSAYANPKEDDKHVRRIM